jgi:uncharacterized OB-fold protein
MAGVAADAAQTIRAGAKAEACRKWGDRQPPPGNWARSRGSPRAKAEVARRLRPPTVPGGLTTRRLRNAFVSRGENAHNGFREPLEKSVTDPTRPLPVPTPETRHYWEGTKKGELRLQRCDACRHVYFPPRPFCPQCASREVSVIKAAGTGRLHSYVIHHRPAPGFTPPYAIAVVELDEGPRLMTNIVGCPQTPEALQLDMRLEVTFARQSEEITLPFFRPAGIGSSTP